MVYGRHSRRIRSDLVGALGHGGLLVRRLVGVDYALARGLVELAARVAHELEGLVLLARFRGLAEPADRGLHRGLDGLVALARLFVRLDPLDLRLDVCHACTPRCRSRKPVPRSGGLAAVSQRVSSWAERHTARTGRG